VNSEQQHPKGHSSRLAMTAWPLSNKRNVLHNYPINAMPTWATSWCHSPLHHLHTLTTPLWERYRNLTVPLYESPKLTVKQMDNLRDPLHTNALPQKNT
jgi:hypothetical protein